jgi:hypothetical protein
MPFTRPWYDDNQYHSDLVAVPRVWLTLILSVLLHLAVFLFVLPQLQKMMMPGEEEGEAQAPISVQLAQAPGARTTPSAPSPSQAEPPPPPPPAPRRPRPSEPRTPPVVSLRPQVPNPDALRVPPPPQTAPAPSPQPPSAPPTVTDMSAYIAQRRAARGETPESDGQAAAPESDTARRDRIVAQNMAAVNSSQPYVGEPKNAGGLFTITQVNYDYGEFKFNGWNNNIKRRAAQVIEVRKGTNADINIAIVRKMIEIIRENTSGDFTWRSDRIGHDVTLSARPEDTAGLEEFLLHDLFGTPGQIAGAPARR